MNITKRNQREVVKFLHDKLHEYMLAKEPLDRRIEENEKWFSSRHWSIMKTTSPNAPTPTSPYIFNTVASKHADMMDSFPSPVILPREPKDAASARLLTAVVPFVLEKNGFRRTYSRNMWSKLKNGGAIYGIFYNSQKRDVEISSVDISRVFWEPNVEDIQSSRLLFVLSVMTKDEIEVLYPASRGRLRGDLTLSGSFSPDKIVVVDCYYKTPLQNGNCAVHLIKFAGDVILDCTQTRSASAKRGLYKSGKYPFVVDSLYPSDGSPVGFGLVDITKNPQSYIDRLDQIISQNAMIAGKVRWLIKDNGGVNENELLDLSNDVIHVAGSVNDANIKEFQARTLDPFIAEHRQNKIRELKETAGNRDLYGGGAEGGITAYSAIAALQEAGSKLSRDILFESYNAYSDIVRHVIDLIVQFYDKKRFIRVGGDDFIEFDALSINADSTFDVSVSAETAAPMARESLNAMALELFNSGFFKSENKTQALAALQVMNFDGKEKIASAINEL